MVLNFICTIYFAFSSFRQLSKLSFGKTQLFEVRWQFLLQDWLLVGQAARGLVHHFTVNPLVFPSLADTCHTHPFFTSSPYHLLLLDGCWRWKRLPMPGWGPALCSLLASHSSAHANTGVWVLPCSSCYTPGFMSSMARLCPDQSSPQH